MNIHPSVVSRHFNDAAGTYDQAAFLQREVGTRLLERLSLLKQKPQVVLDLGAGTGFFRPGLEKLFPEAFVLNLDIALNMSLMARHRTPDAPCLCTDAHHLPFPNQSVDCIFSNGLLQWTDVGAVLAECRRVLRPGGSFFASTFGPDTLKELRMSWASVDDTPHTHQFVDMHHIGDALLQCAYQDPVTDREEIVVTYADLRQLMEDLKDLGAQNADAARNKGLTSPRKMQKVGQAYEQFRRPDKTLPATYEVIYLHAMAPPGPVEKQGSVRYRSAKIDYAT